MLSKEIFITSVILVAFQHCTGQDGGQDVGQVDPASFNWCDPNLNCGPLKNSMCVLGRMRENVNDCFFIENVMTAEDKRLLLAMHNTVRDELAGGDVEGWPEAKDMRQMSWDETLAAQATLWAYQCNMTSDPCPRNPIFPRAGQAAIEVGDTDDFPDVTAIFKKMVNIGREGGPKHVDQWSSESVKPEHRNFYQVVYARQTAVGCGLIRYLKTKKGRGGKNVAIFTLALWCNYGVGLDEGEKVYTKGDACTACPDRTKCKSESAYRHLCATSDDPIYATYIEFISARSGCHRADSITFLTFFSLLASAMVWSYVMTL